MRIDSRKLTYRAGFAAATVIFLAVLAAGLAFSGPGGARYSIFNHDISLLGEPDLSAWATPFNWGLRIGGALLAVFMLGLGLYAGRQLYPVTLAGLIAAAGVTLVGIYSANYQHLHRVAAIIVFAGGLTTVAGFTLYLWLVRQGRLARWLVIPSAAATLAFAAFVFLPYTANTPPLLVFFAGPPGETRPILWLPSLLEWLVLMVVLAWVLTLSFYLYVQDLADEQRAPQPLPDPAQRTVPTWRMLPASSRARLTWPQRVPRLAFKRLRRAHTAARRASGAAPEQAGTRVAQNRPPRHGP